MALPDYVKRAKNNYNSKHELIQLRLPPGSKERLKAIVGDDGSMAAFCVDAILGTIDGYEVAERWIDDELQETTPERPQETRGEDEEETVKKPSKDGVKPAEKRDSTVVLAEMQSAKSEETTQKKPMFTATMSEADNRVFLEEQQAEINRKRQEQEERKQKLEQEKEKCKEEEREQNRLEMRRCAENIRDRAKGNQEQKEIVKQFMDDPFLRENVLKPERREDVVEVVGQETYDAIIEAVKESKREETKRRERMREIEAEPDQGEGPDFMSGL